MNLRIISGDLKSRRISIPEKQVRFRPTTDRVRESLAEMIKGRIPGCRGADFCAGSGAFGMELASRGATLVHFVERDRLLCRGIQAHVTLFGIAEKCRVFEQDIEAFIRRCTYSYDIVFFDPPYDSESLAGLTPKLFSLLSENGVLLYEYAARRKSDGSSAPFPLPAGFIAQIKIYGDTAVAVCSKAA
jgi:16S rRNA (guanine966-N2)-methyltransferase